MPKRIRKRYIFLNLFIVLSFLVSLVIIVFSAKEYTATLTLDTSGTVKIADYSYRVEGDHIEVTDISASDSEIFITVKPLSMGDDVVNVYYSFIDREETGSYPLSFYCGPFKTIFNRSSFFDFRGSIYIILLINLNLLVITALSIVSFFDYLRRADFSYPMVACGGIGIFSLFYLLLNLVTVIDFNQPYFIDPYVRTFGGYIIQLSSTNTQFAFFTAPFMVIFSLALTVSNLFLIRREGFRFVNLLGVFFGVLWLVGFVLNFVIDYNISGSAEYVALISSLSSVISTLISYFECMLFSTILSAFLASRHKPPFDRDYIVILGCAIQKDGSLTPLLRGRVDAALRFATEQKEKTGKPVRFVPSGGQGKDETVSEGEAMRRYLIEQGVEENMILPETKSTNTYENVKFSKEVIEKDTKEEYNAAFATTNYHVFRGYILSRKNKLRNAQGISARTKWYFFPNAFLRELVGLVVDEKLTHLIIVTLLIISFVLMNISSFI